MHADETHQRTRDACDQLATTRGFSFSIETDKLTMARVSMPQASSRRAGAQLALARPSHTAMRRAALLSLLGSAVAAESSSGESDDWMDDETCGTGTTCWKAAVAGGITGVLLCFVLIISVATRKSGGSVSPATDADGSPKLLHEMSPRAYAAAMTKKKKEAEEERSAGTGTRTSII